MEKKGNIPSGMKVHPTHAEGVDEQVREAAAYGQARKPTVETIEVEDLDVDRIDRTPVGDEEMVTAIVAQGRTVDAPIPGKRRLVGYQKDTGKEVYGPVFNRFGPGATVSLPASEVKRLQELGFLFDPSRVVPAIQDGKAHADQEGAHQFIRRQ